MVRKVKRTLLHWFTWLWLNCQKYIMPFTETMLHALL
jgi:hypothetical protein